MNCCNKTQELKLLKKNFFIETSESMFNEPLEKLSQGSHSAHRFSPFLSTSFLNIDKCIHKQSVLKGWAGLGGIPDTFKNTNDNWEKKQNILDNLYFIDATFIL